MGLLPLWAVGSLRGTRLVLESGPCLGSGMGVMADRRGFLWLCWLGALAAGMHMLGGCGREHMGGQPMGHGSRML